MTVNRYVVEPVHTSWPMLIARWIARHLPAPVNVTVFDDLRDSELEKAAR